MAKGASALYDAEVKLADAENTADLVLQRSYMGATGTDKERTAKSRLEAAEARLEADLAKAEVNRIKVKMKMLESAQMATQTISRLVESEMRNL